MVKQINALTKQRKDKNLNTSYVMVKLRVHHNGDGTKTDLNTSYVMVKLKITA